MLARIVPAGGDRRTAWPVALALVHAGDTFGLGRWGKQQPVVRQHPWLV
jgi:hypothetical protein